MQNKNCTNYETFFSVSKVLKEKKLLSDGHLTHDDHGLNFRLKNAKKKYLFKKKAKSETSSFEIILNSIDSYGVYSYGVYSYGVYSYGVYSLIAYYNEYIIHSNPI